MAEHDTEGPWHCRLVRTVAASVLVSGLVAGICSIPATSQHGPTVADAVTVGQDFGVPSAAFIPYVGMHGRRVGPYPDETLAGEIWSALEAFTAAHPPASILPGYAPDAGGPGAAPVAANLDAACHDFPDLPDPFGEGAHHRACFVWVSGYLGLYHAARARHTGDARDLDWAARYLAAGLQHMATMTYGAEDSPNGEGHRDTLAAIWQNPHRAVYLALVGDLVRAGGRLEPAQRAALEEQLSAVSRAWYAEWWETGVHPSHGVTLETRAAPAVRALSLDGHQVVSRMSWSFRWDADKGNTPAEESAWMGAGIVLSSLVLHGRVGEREYIDLNRAGRRYADLALSYDRLDPIRRQMIRTLNAETTGGACGQRRYWLENHTPDVPSIPYVAWTWQYLGAAMLGLPPPQVFPLIVGSDAADGDAWSVMVASAEESFHSPDGAFLVDFSSGGGLGYDVTACPAWGTACGAYRFGTHYVQYDGRAGGPSLYVSEIGHPAGLDLLATAWPILRIAIHRGDLDVYDTWRGRLDRVLAEYTAHPPDPGWAVCGVAPYSSANTGYNWARMLEMYVLPYLGAGGYAMSPWPPASSPAAPDRQRGTTAHHAHATERLPSQ